MAWVAIPAFSVLRKGFDKIDICIDGMSEESMRQQFKNLADSHKLKRFENGIYYIPDIMGQEKEMSLSADTVARYKYIERHGNILGYYAGLTLANMLGISELVSEKQEIVSNNIAAIVREVQIGNRTYVVRKSKVIVTKENYKVLQFLEVLKDLDKFMDVNCESIKKNLAEYVVKNGICRDDVDRYIDKFPLKAYKHIYRLRLDKVLT